MEQPRLVVTNSEAETRQLGKCLAAALTDGITFALNGQLGSGKTNLVRSVCAGLGADEDQVNSPTFVLMQLYPDGRLPVAHFDTYRLADVDEFVAIGGDEYLLDDSMVCFVEWANRVADVLPADHVQIEIRHLGETQRQFAFHASGPRSSAVVSVIGSAYRADNGKCDSPELT